MFPDDETVGQRLEKNIWPDGRRCPKCGHDDTALTKNSRCHTDAAGATSASVSGLEPSRLTPTPAAGRVITVHLLATRPKGISSMQMYRDLGIKQSTAWLLLHKLRKSWHTLTGSDPMSGPVEVDKVCLGGR